MSARSRTRIVAAALTTLAGLSACAGRTRPPALAPDGTVTAPYDLTGTDEAPETVRPRLVDCQYDLGSADQPMITRPRFVAALVVDTNGAVVPGSVSPRAWRAYGGGRLNWGLLKRDLQTCRYTPAVREGQKVAARVSGAFGY